MSEPTPLDDFEPIDDLELPVSLPPNRSTPVVIVEAIRTIVYALQAWWAYTSDAGSPSKTEVRDLEIVRRWLEAQQQQGQWEPLEDGEYDDIEIDATSAE